MLFHFFTSLIEQYSFLNVFKYLTFRTGLSVMTSLIVVFIKPLIVKLGIIISNKRDEQIKLIQESLGGIKQIILEMTNLIENLMRLQHLT